MARYFLTRIGSALLVLVIASIAIFAVIRLVPGDPVSTLAGPDSTAESRAAIRSELGLDRPFFSQYLHWVGDVLRLDLGNSYILGGDVGELVGAGAVNTIILTLFALLIACTLAVTVSTIAVVADKRWLNAILSAGNTVAVAVPTFATSLVLILIFAVQGRLLPAGGIPPAGFFTQVDIAVQYLLLPGLVLALPAWAVLTRFLTESLHTEMGKAYVTTARALGIPRRRIVLTQALRNALPSAITILGIEFGTLLGGAVLIETVFSWPGLGQLIEQGISSRDYPVVQVLLLLSVTVFVITQLISDLTHSLLDPRVRVDGVSR